MSLTLGAVMALSQQCAPGIALEAIVPQVHVESHFNELAIGVNNGPKVHARSLAEAVMLATHYIQAGYSVDLGLAQINSKNLRRLGLTVEQTFDACASLRAASVVLAENYSQVSTSRAGVDAINATWSLYNSGSTTRGIRNGYVGKVWTTAADLIPQMRAILGTGQLPQLSSEPGDASPQVAPPDPQGAASAPLPSPQPQPRWIYGTPNTDAIMFKGQ
ncbi:MAG: lytic transglycosylase domain-containing protein [Novosphingobium sp.]